MEIKLSVTICSISGIIQGQAKAESFCLKEVVMGATFTSIDKSKSSVCEENCHYSHLR